MKDIAHALLFLLLVLLTGCSALMDMRRDCDVLVDKLREAKPAELWSIAQVYRSNGCADSRKVAEPQEWVKQAR